jgi:formate-dependent nitrite reductase membrane component NrfD
LSYHGLPPLRRPHWKWQIPLYFWLSGLASWSYVFATVLDLVGEPADRPIVRTGRYLAVAGAALGAPLLIDDLKRPARFLNMLRVFKLGSPMSVGSWALTAFGAFGALSAAIEWRMTRSFRESGPLCWLAGRPIRRRAIGVFGLPFALVVGSYTGVLLSATAVPLWSRGRVALPPLFVLSGASTALAALSLLSRAHGRLRRLELAALAGELVATAGLLGALGPRIGRPLLRSRLFWGGAVGLGQVAPLLLRGRGPASALALLGALALRWSVVESGKASADDPEASFAHHG